MVFAALFQRRYARSLLFYVTISFQRCFLIKFWCFHGGDISSRGLYDAR